MAHARNAALGKAQQLVRRRFEQHDGGQAGNRRGAVLQRAEVLYLRAPVLQPPPQLVTPGPGRGQQADRVTLEGHRRTDTGGAQQRRLGDEATADSLRAFHPDSPAHASFMPDSGCSSGATVANACM
ncbi:hypothetical protein G6F64_014445 [Rhizopus arrhizus]|uniref:Uncharacterized protein n=1 Tax=Rhizopus oryzae TaxID=64495 RepID=A0A9P6WTN0_RHIOR|nr:hypothetical protein G6F64_014445 [Rhizopus arrhizus]